MKARSRLLRTSLILVAMVACPAPAHAVFHIAHISEVLTAYDGSANVQFVEIIMDAAGQNLVSGSKLNTFDAQGNFIATALTVPGNVQSGNDRRWIMGTPAFETASGLQVDFEFPNASLPAGGGMVCWGKPGSNPTPISCPSDGSPYVDCLAYGSYSGPSNDCIGDPNPIAPEGHSLQRVDDTHDNATDFVCASTIEPENNAGTSVSLPATTPCPGDTTTSTTSTTAIQTTTSTIFVDTSTTTTLPGVLCGDATGDGDVTASDALVALRTAVGSASCAASICDVDDNGTVSAADALRILARAVGQDVELACPSA